MLLTCIKADLELLLQGHLRETGYTDFFEKNIWYSDLFEKPEFLL